MTLHLLKTYTKAIKRILIICKHNRNNTIKKTSYIVAMKKISVFLVLLCCLSSAKSFKKARAYSSKTGQLVYSIEIIHSSEKKIVFNLKSSVGALIGTKTFNFGDLCPYSPSVESQNFIFPQSSSVKVTANQVRIRNFDEGKQTQANFNNACDLVWDFGIHRFILDHWEELNQKEIQIKLLAPAEGKVFSFILSRESNRVILTPESMLVKMFVDEIYFQYNSKKELVEYKGMADMKNSEGASESVIIKYENNLHN